MTNKEILQANLLNIIFENRNKEYGAYVLRKGYNKRMLTALGAGMSVILLLILINGFSKNENLVSDSAGVREGIIIKSYLLPKEPVQPKEKDVVKQKPVIKTASRKYISNIKIVKEVKSAMAAMNDMDGKNIDDVDLDGKKTDGSAQLPIEPEFKPVVNDIVPAEPKTREFIIQERDPEFPGGPAALKMFLSKYLGIPGSLEAGDKKIVKIRFKVDKDGSVNSFEIASSGGKDFDNEVIRVCNKMPRWMPAIQNGINVPVSYVLPVTFIGVEE